MIGTLVLRFRDIERPVGETIEAHREIISSRKGVWWGWLYRTYERIPSEYLNSYVPEGARERPVYLYDTGQGVVYKCTCTSITVDERPELSPKPALTPAYYNGRAAPAWFFFTSIETVSVDELIGSTCVDLPSATPECSVDLLDAKVTRLSDLRRQEVTMWILANDP